jgi:hypothetical protein
MVETQVGDVSNEPVHLHDMLIAMATSGGSNWLRW